MRFRKKFYGGAERNTLIKKKCLIQLLLCIHITSKLIYIFIFNKILIFYVDYLLYQTDRHNSYFCSLMWSGSTRHVGPRFYPEFLNTPDIGPFIHHFIFI